MFTMKGDTWIEMAEAGQKTKPICQERLAGQVLWMLKASGLFIANLKNKANSLQTAGVH